MNGNAKINKRYGILDSGIIFSIVAIAAFVVSLAAQFIIMAALGQSIRSTDSYEISFPDSAMYVLLVLNQVVMFFTVFIYSKRKNINAFKVCGLNKRPKLLNATLTPLAGFGSIFTFYPLLIAFLLMLQAMGFSSSALPIPSATNAGGVVLSIFLTCALPAFCEELLFRGVILNGLRQKGDVFAILISAMLFSLFHQNPQQTVHQFLLGIVLAYLAIKTRSIWIPMLVHFFNNFIVTLFDYFTLKDTSEAVEIAMTSEYWILFAIAIVTLLATITAYYFINKKSNTKDAFLVTDESGIPLDEHYETLDVKVYPHEHPLSDEALQKRRVKMFWAYAAMGLGLCAISWIVNFATGFM